MGLFEVLPAAKETKEVNDSTAAERELQDASARAAEDKGFLVRIKDSFTGKAKSDAVDVLHGDAIHANHRFDLRTAVLKEVLTFELATALHEQWRETRKQPDGSFLPRVKATTDQAWIAAHGTDKVDIANTTYKDLPEDWKGENKISADIAIKDIYSEGDAAASKVDELSSDIHEKWVERRQEEGRRGADISWSKHLFVPYAELPIAEAEKDSAIINLGLELYADQKEILPLAEKVSGLVLGYLVAERSFVEESRVDELIWEATEEMYPEKDSRWKMLLANRTKGFMKSKIRVATSEGVTIVGPDTYAANRQEASDGAALFAKIHNKLRNAA